MNVVTTPLEGLLVLEPRVFGEKNAQGTHSGSNTLRTGGTLQAGVTAAKSQCREDCREQIGAANRLDEIRLNADLLAARDVAAAVRR